MPTFVGFDLYKFALDETGRLSWADLTTHLKSDPTVEDIEHLGTASIGLFRKGCPPNLEDPCYKGVISMTIFRYDFVNKMYQLAADPIIKDLTFAGFYRGFTQKGIKVYVPNDANETQLIEHFRAFCYKNQINYKPKNKYPKLENYK